LGKNTHIRQARLAAYRLAALNQDWLLRAGVQGDAYTNGDVPTESYQGVGAEATLGYMGKTNSGTDIALTFKQERHPAYRMGRSAMKLAHYFPHRKGQAYWSLRGTYQQDAATDDSLDGAGNALGIGYEQWSLGLSREQRRWNGSKSSMTNARQGEHRRRGCFHRGECHPQA
jgi:hypothetical protein